MGRNLGLKPGRNPLGVSSWWFLLHRASIKSLRMGGDQGNLGGINAQPKPSRSNVDIFYDTPRCQAVVSDIAPTSIRSHTVARDGVSGSYRALDAAQSHGPNRRKHVKLPSRIGELRRSWEVRRSPEVERINKHFAMWGTHWGTSVENRCNHFRISDC